MEIVVSEIKFYWNDLKEETQKKILDIFGDNNNWDVVPFCTIEIGEDVQ